MGNTTAGRGLIRPAHKHKSVVQECSGVVVYVTWHGNICTQSTCKKYLTSYIDACKV